MGLRASKARDIGNNGRTNYRRRASLRFSHLLAGEPVDVDTSPFGWLRHLRDHGGHMAADTQSAEFNLPRQHGRGGGDEHLLGGAAQEALLRQKNKRLRRRTAPPGFHRGWEFVLGMTGSSRIQEERSRYERVEDWVSDVVRAGAVGPDAEDANLSESDRESHAFGHAGFDSSSYRCLDGGQGFDAHTKWASLASLGDTGNGSTGVRRRRDAASAVAAPSTAEFGDDGLHDPEGRPITWVGPLPPARPVQRNSSTISATFVMVAEGVIDRSPTPQSQSQLSQGRRTPVHASGHVRSHSSMQQPARLLRVNSSSLADLHAHMHTHDVLSDRLSPVQLRPGSATLPGEHNRQYKKTSMSELSILSTAGSVTGSVRRVASSNFIVSAPEPIAMPDTTAVPQPDQQPHQLYSRSPGDLTARSSNKDMHSVSPSQHSSHLGPPVSSHELIKDSPADSVKPSPKPIASPASSPPPHPPTRRGHRHTLSSASPLFPAPCNEPAAISHHCLPLAADGSDAADVGQLGEPTARTFSAMLPLSDASTFGLAPVGEPKTAQSRAAQSGRRDSAATVVSEAVASALRGKDAQTVLIGERNASISVPLMVRLSSNEEDSSFGSHVAPKQPRPANVLRPDRLRRKVRSACSFEDQSDHGMDGTDGPRLFMNEDRDIVPAVSTNGHHGDASSGDALAQHAHLHHQAQVRRGISIRHILPDHAPSVSTEAGNKSMPLKLHREGEQRLSRVDATTDKRPIVWDRKSVLAVKAERGVDACTTLPGATAGVLANGTDATPDAIDDAMRQRVPWLNGVRE
ncbi:hypothetical protein THASP1DRAFT_23317 [Thamnocephalis sphaerospora]|uniref:Uncharacterized protein n=1 Tax=Thamnocephalis sphaerospora TaxID=78915 RepID=A0A4P9XRM3_9FUNG|nr:hypothetical protein THASP1DRAFT_23317 [Thamnocephalis sphaerospora]|eukprot:RKP08743.1 hypothetical protein THASP1DRAFT_23317 [Thamnocephalis sphaerospora]